MSRRDGIIIAIDGPAGSGKSSTAGAVAAALGYRHLDSGAFYRAVTLAVLEAGISPERWPDLDAATLDGLGIDAAPDARGYRLTIGGRDVTGEIRSNEVNAHVSTIAALPAVRSWLMDTLRRAGAAGGLVSDGRDIGTIVFPDAELKVYLVCEPEERARRRLAERGDAGPSPAEIRAESERLMTRDALDSTRSVAPLSRAPGAVLVDTTNMDFDEQVRSVVDLARSRIPA